LFVLSVMGIWNGGRYSAATFRIIYAITTSQSTATRLAAFRTNEGRTIAKMATTRSHQVRDHTTV